MEQKSKATVWIIGLVVVIALGAWWLGRRRVQPTSTPVSTPDTEQTGEDPALAYLEQLQTVVYRVTYDTRYQYETDAGQTAEIERHVTDKISRTPELQVTQIESHTGRDLDGEYTAEVPEKPTYTIYHGDGTTTNYFPGVDEDNRDTWYTADSDDLWHGLTSGHLYAHTWAVAATPVKISDGVYQAPVHEPDSGTYTFYFDDRHQLTRVTWQDSETNDETRYEILDEPAVREVPAEIVSQAINMEI